MRSTILTRGRHRFGTPGLVPVRQFVTVHHRNWLARLLGFGRRPGRHHRPVEAAVPAESGTPALQAAAA